MFNLKDKEKKSPLITAEGLRMRAQGIVEKSRALKNKHIDDKHAPVNYACIFSQSNEEYHQLVDAARELGKIVKVTPSGLLFRIRPLLTVAGMLKLLKIRLPDSTRPEQGDADFTISDFLKFKEKYLYKPGFKLIRRPDMEMVELMEPEFDVRTYFSNPPLDVQLKIR